MSGSVFVVSDRTGVVGSVTKETAEVGRATFDFGCWLDPGELIGFVSRFSLAPDGVSVGSAWQLDYPFPAPHEEVVSGDVVPLVFTGATTDNGKIVNVLFGAGTPGFVYTASFIVVGNRSGREKQINFLVAIPEMTNPAMISSLDPAPSVTFTTVTSTIALPLGTTGTVFVNNATGGMIAVTLPPSPANGQALTCIDEAGNAAAHTIRFVAAAGALITNQDFYDFRVAYQSAVFQWNGEQWMVA